MRIKIFVILLATLMLIACQQEEYKGGEYAIDPNDTASKHKLRKDNTRVEKEYERAVEEIIDSASVKDTL